MLLFVALATVVNVALTDLISLLFVVCNQFILYEINVKTKNSEMTPELAELDSMAIYNLYLYWPYIGQGLN